MTPSANDPNLNATNEIDTAAEVHAEIAQQAQAAADAAIEAGDYAEAAELRATAEEHAYEAGTPDMLSGADSLDLEQAAHHQEVANDFNEQQIDHAQDNDYEAARDDSLDAAWHTQQADGLAGGPDQSDQAQIEASQMDWADWNQDWAAEDFNSAEVYAAEGDFETAEMYTDDAIDHQETADNYGDLGEHDSFDTFEV